MNFEKKTNIYRIVMAIIVTATITFMLTTVLFHNYYFKTEDGLADALMNMRANSLDEKIKLIKIYLDELYLGEINEEEMQEMAVKGYVAGLKDEYTEYLTEDEYEELMVDVNGNYVGIGIYMAQDRNGNVVVLAPIKGSPAEEVGLKTGDIITKVNGEDVAGVELSIIANKVKGEEGTTVDIEIKRDNETITKTMTRKKVEINQINAEVLEDNIGYIQIMAFDDKCAEKFKNKLNELLQKGIKSLIIDVRDNGGGIVDEAIDIADLFLPKDKTIMIELDKKENEELTKAEDDAIINSDFKVIVLSNENTASASEILAGALKDNNIAKVVGTKTYGKGVMQEIVSISTGGALKLTIKEFRTPNGNKIDKEGIAPDIEVNDIEETELDEQLQKAIEELKK